MSWNKFKNSAEWNRSEVKAGSTNLDIGRHILKGNVPKELLGLGGSEGGSMFSGVAHEQQQAQKINNLVNFGVHHDLRFQMMDANNKAITHPFELNGKMMVPDAKGVVKVIDNEPIQMMKKIKDFQEKRCDDLMDLFLLGDDVCAYILGMKEDEWKVLAQPYPAGGAGIPADLYNAMSKEMRDENCMIDNIEMQVSGSIAQTRQLSKLRKVVKHFMTYINIDNFSNLTEHMENKNNGKATTNNTVDILDDVQARLTAAGV